MYLRSRTPLRISFVGGGTDLPGYYDEFGGAVLASTINRFTYVTLAPRSDGYLSISSLDTDATVRYRLDEQPGESAVLRLAEASARHHLTSNHASKGVDLYIRSDAPAGSGLGGSSALTIAVLGTMSSLGGRTLAPDALAELAYTIERVDLQISGGKQDQYAIAYGGFNLIEFGKDGVSVQPVTLPHAILNDLEYHLMLCYTGKTRTSAHITDGLDAYIRARRPQTIEALGELHQLVFAMRDVLVAGRLRELAEMLDHAWDLKLKINPPEVTDASIDELYHEAKRQGALGGKLLGAGGGGYLLLFCESSRHRAVREALGKMGAQFAPFGFVGTGFECWRSDYL